MKFILFAALFVAQTYSQLCNDLATFGDTDQDKIDRCQGFTTDEECGCTWASGGSEGCVSRTWYTDSPFTISTSMLHPQRADHVTNDPCDDDDDPRAGDDHHR